MRAVGLLLALVLMLRSPIAIAQSVDLELILAVYVSMSMDAEEQVIQRQGYAEAFRSPAVLDAIRNGPTGRIAVSYVEWAGVADQRIVIPWTLVDGEAAAAAVADTLLAAPRTRIRRTSISGALGFSQAYFAENPHRGLRRVIDISGDGPNNQGPIVTDARDAAVAKGITVNGLPLMFRAGGMMDIDRLDDYYRDCVIGGVGAFVLPVTTKENFARAIRDKLILEISGLTPSGPSVLTADATAPAPTVSCTIGEFLWRQRMEN